MFTWIKRRINFLETIKDRWLFIVIYLVFGVVFINLFEPFNVYEWSKFKDLPKLALSVFHMLPFCAGILFTQFVIRRFLKNQLFSIRKLLWWIAAEIAVISVFNISIFGSPELLFSEFFYDAIYYTSLVLLLCYFVSLTILSLVTRKTFFQKKQTTSLLPIKDYKNKVKITLDHHHILLVKSTENYVQIYYLSNGEVKKVLIRNTLKTLENLLEPYEILRAQRSYLVNKNQISSIESNQKKRVIYLRNLKESIPLSDSYISNFNEISVQKK